MVEYYTTILFPYGRFLCVCVSYKFKQNVVYGMSLFVFFKLHVDML